MKLSFTAAASFGTLNEVYLHDATLEMLKSGNADRLCCMLINGPQ